MTTMELATHLVELCRAGQNIEAINTFYADDVVSVEAGGPPGQDRTSRGKAAVIAKNHWWVANHEMHSTATEGPFPHDDRFAVRFTYDVTNKPSGKRFTMNEVALYTVEDGKIVREEFFYGM
jgi:ketosteroid isomerase-like protein